MFIQVTIIAYCLVIQHIQGESNISLRLVGSIRPDRGIVEINNDGIWGAMCNAGLNKSDVGNICKLLEFPNGGELIPSKAFTQISDRIWVDIFSCDNITDADDCFHSNWGNYSCTDQNVVAIWCYTEEFKVILVDGNNPNEGRVQIYTNNTVGTICDDYFGNEAADVTCRMLGYKFGGTVHRMAKFGSGDGQVLLDDVKCSGSESDIMDCEHTGWEGNDCTHAEDVGVTCYQGEWVPWSHCTTSCGGGSRTRFVTCRSNFTLCSMDVDMEVCNTDPCPINGQWGHWQAWSACPVTCGYANRTRSRDCNDPFPAYGGNNCTGEDIELQLCYSGSMCAVDGAWSKWSNWTACSVTCGDGVQERMRMCIDPEPQYGGNNCSGNSMERKSCNSGLSCPVDGGWSGWSEWSSCSAECDCGTRTRHRKCDNPQPLHNGHKCDGESTEETFCTSGKLCHESCRSDQFLCDDQKTCVERTMSCDGIQQCPGGEDEADCLEILFLPLPTVISGDTIVDADGRN